LKAKGKFVQEDFRLIIDLVTVLGVAAVGGLLASLLRQPVLLGYILAGMIVGPAGLGVIKEVVQVETLAQLGVAFLLFALGVGFSLSELKKVQKISLGGGGLQILLTILTTAAISLVFGWGALVIFDRCGVALSDGSGRNRSYPWPGDAGDFSRARPCRGADVSCLAGPG
jgi:Kef-type K+ transport system membrane component KefB